MGVLKQYSRSAVVPHALSPTERREFSGLLGRDQLVAYFKGPSLEDTVGVCSMTITSGTAANFTQCTFQIDYHADLAAIDTGGVLYSGTTPIARTWLQWMALATINVDFFFVGARGFAVYSTDQSTNADRIKSVLRSTLIGTGWCTDVPQSEADALVNFYNSTGGANWTNKTNWLTTGTVGNWYGVTVSAGHITQVNLSANAATLDGQGLKYIGNLLSIQNIYLQGTKVQGNLADLSQCTALKEVYLYSTPVVSDISDARTLINLTRLYLYNNNVNTSYTPAILPSWSNAVIQVQHCLLSQDEVDNLLCDLASAGGTNGTLNMAGSNAAPSAAGLVCKDTLVANGWSVTVTT